MLQKHPTNATNNKILLRLHSLQIAQNQRINQQDLFQIAEKAFHIRGLQQRLQGGVKNLEPAKIKRDLLRKHCIRK